MIAPLARTDHIVGNHGLCERDANWGWWSKNIGDGCSGQVVIRSNKNHRYLAVVMGGPEMAEISTTASGLSPAEHHSHLRRALIASTVGTTIEWYDFLLYGTVTGLVFGKVFFPGRIR